MTRKISEQVWTRWLPALGIAGVMFYYALFHYQHALNIPFADDIHDVLLFLTNVVQSTERMHTLELFFEQTNEHRTLSSRLIYYMAFFSEGEINFRTLVFLANIALPLLLMMLYLPLRNHPKALLMLLPAALVLFQIRSYELSFWSMSAFAYMFVYLYAFASLSCLRKVSFVRFLLAVVFASLGSFTFASGQLIWLVGLVSLLQQALVLRRISLAYVVCWAVCAVLVLMVWRIGYETSNTMAVMLTYFFEEPLHGTAYFLELLGNAVSGDSVWLSACAGLVMLVIVVYLSIRGITREDVSLELFSGYIVISVFAISLGRAPLTTLEYALTSRYSFPSVLLLATTIVLVASRAPVGFAKLRVYSVIILLACAYWMSAFHVYPVMLQRMLQRTVSLYNQEKYWAFGRPMKETNAIAEEAISLGIYKPPLRPHPKPDAYLANGKSKTQSLQQGNGVKKTLDQ